MRWTVNYFDIIVLVKYHIFSSLFNIADSSRDRVVITLDLEYVMS